MIAATTATMTAAQTSAEAPSKPEPPVKPQAKPARTRWKLGVLDRSLGLAGNPEALAWASELLFEGLALALTPENVATLNADDVRKRYRADARKLRCPITAIVLEAKDVAALEALLGAAVPLAKAVAAPVVRVGLFGARPAAELELAAHLLGKVAPMAARARVTLGLATSLPAAETRALIAGVKSSAVKIAFDVGAAARARLDVPAELRAIGRGQLCDLALAESSGYLGQRGKDGVDVAAVIATLREIGYDRAVTLATDAPSGDAEADMLANQRYVRDLLRGPQ